MAHIFIIDDDTGIRKLIENTLIKDGHTVTSKESAMNLDPTDFQSVDLILLDVMMPGIDGFSFCKEIRQCVDCPILFLTAKSTENDVVEGLALGADDYIKKPFSISELRARVNAHLRRETRERKQSLTVGEIEFNLLEKTINVKNTKLTLTKGEYEICELLARHRGQVFSLEHILEEVFGFDSESDISAIRVHVKNIRSKFAPYIESPIETVWGVGYIWR